MDPDDIWMHHPDNISQRALDRLVENTRKLVPVAEDAGCMLCPETTQFTIVHNIETMKECFHWMYKQFIKDKKPIAAGHIRAWIQARTPTHNLERLFTQMQLQRLMYKDPTLRKSGEYYIPGRLKTDP